MAHNTGKNVYIQWVYGTAEYILSGTVTPASDYRSVSWDETIDKVDISAGSDTDRDHLATLRDVTFDLILLDNGTDGSAIYRAFASGNHGTLTIAPLGTAAGNPRYACWAFVDGSPREFTYDGETVRSYTLQRRGGWIYNYDHLGSSY